MAQHTRKILQRNKQVFDKLCRACSEISYAFSTYNFVALFAKFLSLIGGVVAFFLLFKDANELLSASKWVAVYKGVTDGMKAVVHLYFASILTNQVKQLVLCIDRILCL